MIGGLTHLRGRGSGRIVRLPRSADLPLRQHFFCMKTAVITGASNGIGLATALALGRKGFWLGLVCRNKARAERVLHSLFRECPDAKVDIFLADLSVQSNIRRLARDLQLELPSIDVLVHNAGVFCPDRVESADGIELTWAVNHLAPFLLTELLFEHLLIGGPARVVVVSSAAHRLGQINFADPELHSGYGMMKAYCQSKLANVMFTFALARRLAGSPATANCLHPGTVRTGLGSRAKGILVALGHLISPILLSPAQGAESPVYLATSPEADGISGKYFESCRISHSSTLSLDEEAQERLWELSARTVGVRYSAPVAHWFDGPPEDGSTQSSDPSPLAIRSTKST
jgi:NAD(P)-dependent dehydrogenase (short-subunit alcohol dehydrogenase family)